jgi:23S rRNA (cytidine2498-2'-O)-methyltransferase
LIVMRAADGDDAGLLAELRRGYPSPARVIGQGLVEVEDPPEGCDPMVALARQALPAAEAVAAPSVNGWARLVVERVLAGVPEGATWRLHAFAHYGGRPAERMGARAFHSVRRRGEPVPTGPTASAAAGEQRCKLILAAIRDQLKERRRAILRALNESTAPFGPDEFLVQLLLTSPEAGWLSVARPIRPLVSPFPGGEVPLAVDKAAPSRAFAKLVEAELRLGRGVAAGETCVDLGASPGGWTWVAVQRNAKVIAVDRSPLRDDLMRDPRVTFVKGDAFAFRPDRPVDWLLCDVIGAPERAIDTLIGWLHRGDARGFVVTVKLAGPADHPKLDRLKRELPALCDDWALTHLCANKGEACVFGRSRQV